MASPTVAQWLGLRLAPTPARRGNRPLRDRLSRKYAERNARSKGRRIVPPGFPRWRVSPSLAICAAPAGGHALQKAKNGEPIAHARSNHHGEQNARGNDPVGHRRPVRRAGSTRTRAQPLSPQVRAGVVASAGRVHVPPRPIRDVESMVLVLEQLSMGCHRGDHWSGRRLHPPTCTRIGDRASDLGLFIGDGRTEALGVLVP